MPPIPDGWTDDMNVPLPPGRTYDDVVDLVLANGLAKVSDDITEQQLVDAFSLSPEDAAVARDRAFGGVYRAGTCNPLNCPDRAKDPLAWLSYQRATADLSIFTRLFAKS